MLEASIRGRVRGNGSRPMYGDGSPQPFDITPGGEQIVAAGLPQNAALVSLGNSWIAMDPTPRAPVVAVPTTAALIGLWNGEPEGTGKSYIIDAVVLLVAANTAAVQNHGILFNNAFQRVDTAIANTLTPRGMRGLRVYNGNGRVAVGLTLDATNGIAANWFPCASSFANSNTPQIGQTLFHPLNGSIIVPPKGQISLTCIAGATTASSVNLGLVWHEAYVPPTA